MTPADVLPWLNVLLVPMGVHIMRTESRITRLEAQMDFLIKKLSR